MAEQNRLKRMAASKLPWRHVALLATSAALVAGASQVLDVLVRQNMLHQFTFTSSHVIWMAPLANLILVLPVAVALSAFAWLTPYRVAVLASAATCACYAVYSIVLLFPGLHQFAMMLITLGIAIRFAGAVGSAPDRWISRMGRIAISLSLILGALALGDWSWRTAGERRALASLDMSRSGAPNVLLVVLDTVRALNLDTYGYVRPTAPEISRRGREGAVFDWAIATTSWTLPSHGSMFTGRRPDELSARLLSPLDATHQTIAEVFRDNGYATGGFIANFFYTAHESGLDRGFIHYADSKASLKQLLLTAMLLRADSVRDAIESLRWDHSLRGAIKAMLGPPFRSRVRFRDVDRKAAGDVNAEFLRWQAALKNKPFFAFLNYFDAHTPYEPPPPFYYRFSKTPVSEDLYDAGIAYIDYELSLLFQELERRGVLDRTIVIIASDHGEQFGGHGKWQHTNSLYAQTTHVPLIMRFPAKIPAGIRIHQTVTLQDLPATLLELAGMPGAGRIGGSSFASLVTGAGRTLGSPVVAELEEHVGVDNEQDTPEIRAVFDDSFHYIVSGRKREQLYAYRTDQREMIDLAATPRGAEALQRLRALLFRASSRALKY
jgi:arylsulfatase A-like enzyme